ncbi:DNA-processing protein DprA [Pediococcus pentosaceus]|mgnify:FL=1|uniref:DNA-processing protein DprA n=1 Tax=Pediococcus pentosaceus CGMCC 7049 TaxID=1460385 RepID=A0AAU7NJ46_PEDPE|nr:DNA-processing protein DprA [Pediococcus pentosaceus]MCS8562992.1 DNA-protecting protein DprA [Pediococcus pentosaceus]MCS8567207.1 DNA-protecting protein DprA [Pediococcus pentosaceus]MCS8569432.1 DNA-protecting protein DprA [Pediococcus pentosaceus]MCS8570649.1 DNA-protecting protein DprA [Pediococcus pentosaceus]MCS8580070.1 DNA-protecting protein DprA [Pediococcus pentosaceus]
MEIRDFLIRVKVGTNLGIKKQYQIYQEIRKSPNLSIAEWIETTKLIKESQKDELTATLQSEQLTHEIQINEQSGGILTILDEMYPKLLREIYCPPTVLFYNGNLSLLSHQRAIAIVGARMMTSYGEQAIKCLIPGVVANQLTTVSGLAKGVDALVHEATLANAGSTIAVIGNGLDITYPKQNAQLQNQIQKEGLILSEYPRGARPLRHHFVERNRIIAGLTTATCVVEARKNSGSLITASLALTENRNVLAIPGSIFSGNSQGTNQLIAAGARPLIELDDVLEEVL